MAAPPAGQVRSIVMDEHPWTYELSNEELLREHAILTDPDSLLVGNYRQYAIGDYDISEHGAQGVQFEIKLAALGVAAP